MLALVPKLLGSAVAVVGALWLGIAGAWLMHRFDTLTATPAYHFKCCLVVRFTLTSPVVPAYVQGMNDPNSPAAKALRVCHLNTATLEAALGRQNAAVAAVSAAGAQARARAESAIHASQAATAQATANEARILAAIKPGEDRCQAYDAVDAAFKASLSGR